jgi:hypothetical protein
MGTGVAVGGIGVLVGRGVLVGISVFVGCAGVIVTNATTVEVELGSTMGVPKAAWVCWATTVCAAAVYTKLGSVVGEASAPGKLQAVSNSKVAAINNNGCNLFANIKSSFNNPFH